MEVTSVCRICLSNETSNYISDLKQNHKTCSEIILFCLNIQLEIDSTVSMRLCIKCFRKIISFYNFKLLALKNDADFKDLKSNLHIKNEPFLYENNDDLKDRELVEGEINVCKTCNEDEINVMSVKPEMQLKSIKDEDDFFCQSDDEFLGDIKKIKYEFIPLDNKTSENVQKKTKNFKKLKSRTTCCEECGKSVKDMKEHMMRHERHRDVRLRLPCSLCNKTFASPDTRYRHKRKIHFGVKLPCSICNKEVLELKTHMLMIHNQSKMRYECASCGKRFISPSQRDKHASIHTAKVERPHPHAHTATEELPHACDVCTKKFRRLSQLNVHKKRIHNAEKIFLCQYCCKTFAEQGCLKKHLREHPLECRIHTKEKPFQCKECDKAFASSTTLRQHMYTHSDEKAFKCTVCEKRFKAPK